MEYTKSVGELVTSPEKSLIAVSQRNTVRRKINQSQGFVLHCDTFFKKAYTARPTPPWPALARPRTTPSVLPHRVSSVRRSALVYFSTTCKTPSIDRTLASKSRRVKLIRAKSLFSMETAA